MVGTTPTVPAPATVAAIRERLARYSWRFLHVHRAVQTMSMDDLAELVAEIVTDHAEHLVAERDALAEDLAWELNATRTTPADAAGGGA